MAQQALVKQANTESFNPYGSVASSVNRYSTDAMRRMSTLSMPHGALTQEAWQGGVARGNWPAVPELPAPAYVPIRKLPAIYDSNGVLGAEQIMTVVHLDHIVTPFSSIDPQASDELSLYEMTRLLMPAQLEQTISVWGMKVTFAQEGGSGPAPIRVQMVAEDRLAAKFSQNKIQDIPSVAAEAVSDYLQTPGGLGWSSQPLANSQPWQYLYDNTVDMNQNGTHEMSVDDCYFKLGGGAKCDVKIVASTPFSDDPSRELTKSTKSVTDTGILKRNFRVGVQLLVSFAPVATEKYAVEFVSQANEWAVNLHKRAPCDLNENMRQEAGMYWPLPWELRIKSLLSLSIFPQCASIMQQGLARKLFNRTRIDGVSGGEKSGYAAIISGGEPALWLLGGPGPSIHGAKGYIHLGAKQGGFIGAKKAKKAPSSKKKKRKH
jgi:hypothetical protein